MSPAVTHDHPADAAPLPIAINVLVVEDDFGDYDAVARALRKMEHFTAQVTRAKTLEAARRHIADTHYDVFLIDYNLGSESGARFLTEIGGRIGRGVPILLTGLLNREIHEIALQAGAISCINKSDLSPTLLETTFRYGFYTHRIETEISELLGLLTRDADNPALAETVRGHMRKWPVLAQAAAARAAWALPPLAVPAHA